MMRPKGLYTLDKDGNPRPCFDVHVWGTWYGINANRRVALTRLANGVKVSTVFLALDHGLGGKTPVLWESMVFAPGYEFDEECLRCSGNWDQAEAMHRTMVDKVKDYLNEKGTKAPHRRRPRLSP